MSVFRIKHKHVTDTWVARCNPRMFDVYGPSLTIHKTAAWSAKNRWVMERVYTRMLERRAEIARLEPDRNQGLSIEDCWEITEDES